MKLVDKFIVIFLIVVINCTNGIVVRSPKKFYVPLKVDVDVDDEYNPKNEVELMDEYFTDTSPNVSILLSQFQLKF